MGKADRLKKSVRIVVCSALAVAGMAAAFLVDKNVGYYNGVRYYGCTGPEMVAVDTELTRFEPYLGIKAAGVEVHCGDFSFSSAEACFPNPPGGRGLVIETGPIDPANHLLCYSHEYLSMPIYRDAILEEMAHVYNGIRADVRDGNILSLNKSQFTRQTEKYMLCDGSSKDLDPYDIYNNVFVPIYDYLFNESSWPTECFAKYLKMYLQLEDSQSIQDFKSRAPRIYEFFNNEVTEGDEPPFR